MDLTDLKLDKSETLIVEDAEKKRRSLWREIWIVFMLFTVLSSYLICTYMTAFDVRQRKNLVLLIIFYGADIIFFFEGFFRICWCMGRRGQRREGGKDIKPKNWFFRIPFVFLFDLFSVIPFELLVFVFYPGSLSNLEVELSFSTEVMTVMSLLRLNRVLRLYRIFSFYGHKKTEVIDNILGWEAYAIIISFAAFLVVLFHGVACMWYALHCGPAISDAPPDCIKKEMEKSQRGQYAHDVRISHPFYQHVNENTSDPWGWYVGALHWSVMSLRNSGNKYIPPVTPDEMLISIFIMIFGFLMCNTIIGVSIYVITLLDLKRSLFFHNSEAITSHIEHFNFPRMVKNHVQESFNYIWQKKRMFSDEPLKLLLPLHIQKEIGREIFYKMIQKSDLLRCLNRNTLDNLGLSVVIRHFVEREFLIRPTSTNYNAYYIVNGIIEVLNEDGSPYVMLSSGSLIGEINLVYPFIRRNAVYAVTPAEIITVSYQDLTPHLENDPVGHAKMIKLILERVNGIQKRKMDLILGQDKPKKDPEEETEGSESQYESDFEEDELGELKSSQIPTGDSKGKSIRPQNYFNIINWLAVDKNLKRRQKGFDVNYEKTKSQFHQKAQRSYIISSVLKVPNYSLGSLNKLAITKSSLFYYVWDLFIFIVIIGHNFLYPMQLAWNSKELILPLNCSIDVLYILDLILQLFIFRYRFEMEPFTPHSVLIKRRLRSWSVILFDVIPTLPIHWIGFSHLHLNRDNIRELMLWRIYICLKFGKIYAKFKQLENNVEFNTVKIRVFRHAIFISLFTVWLGSIFCIIGCPSYPDCTEKWSADVSTSWVDIIKLYHNDSTSNSNNYKDAYPLSIYWGICTIFGVVFPDIQMVTWVETTVHSIGLLLGFILFAYFCADLSATLAGYVEHKMHMTDNLVWIAQYLEEAQIERATIRRVSNFLELQWEVLRGHQIEPSNAYGFLQISHTIARELHVHILADALLKTKVFQGVNPDIVLRICRSSRLIVLQPKEYLVSCGDWMRKIYVVRKGIANVYLRNSAIKIDTICNGDVFGLENIIYEIPSLITAKAITYMEIIVIEASVFYSNLRNAPFLLTALDRLRLDKDKLVEYAANYEYPCKEVCEKFDFLIHAKEPPNTSVFKYNSSEDFAPPYRIRELREQVRKETRERNYLKKNPEWNLHRKEHFFEEKKKERRQEKTEELTKEIHIIKKELKYLNMLKSGKYEPKKMESMKKDIAEMKNKWMRQKNAKKDLQRDLNLETRHPIEFEEHLRRQSSNIRGPGWKSIKEMFIKLIEGDRDIASLEEDIKLLDYQSKEEEYKQYIRPYIQLGVFGFIRFFSLPLTFLPEGKLFMRWEMFHMLTIIFVLIFLPPMESFPVFKSTLYPYLLFADFIGILDMFIRFHVAYYEKYSRELITHPILTLRNYFKTGFITDLLASGPTAFLINFFLNSYPYSKWLWFLRLNRLISAYQLIRFNQYKNFMKIKKLEGAVNLTQIIILILYHIHFMACVMAALSCPAPYGEPTPQPRCIPDTWITDYFNKTPPSNPSRGTNVSESDIYTLAFYYYGTTSMGCAFGDYFPVNAFERAVTTIVFLIHIFILAFIFASLSGRKSHKDFKLVRYQEQMEYLAMFLRREKIPFRFTRSIIMFYEYQWSRTKGIEPRDLLKSLYPTLRRDTGYLVFEDCFRMVPAFQGVPKSFIRAISIHIVPKYFPKHTLIGRKGDMTDLIYFIRKGKVALTYNLALETLLDEGGIIGEIDPSVLYTKYEASAIAVENLDVFVIPKKHYNRIVVSFPKIVTSLKAFIKHKKDEGMKERKRKEWAGTERDSVEMLESDFYSSLSNVANKTDSLPTINENKKEQAKHYLTNKEIFKTSERKEMRAIQNLNFMVVLASFISSIFALYQWAFSAHDWIIYIVGYISDAIFIFKIYMTFRVGLLSGYGELITERAEIRNRYLSDPTGFPLDFFTIFPFEVFVFAYWHAKSPTSDIIHNIWSKLRLNRIFRFVHVIKYFLGVVNMLSVNLTLAKICRLIAYTTFFLHFLCCFFYYFTDYLKERSCTADEDINDAGKCSHPTAWYHTKMGDLAALDKDAQFETASYTYTSYFIISTFTTTAYGDILPVTKFEMVFVTLLSICSRIWIGVTISTILSALQNKTDLTYHMAKDGLVNLYEEYDLSTEIIEKCKKYFRMYWMHNKGVMIPEFLMNAPECLQLDIFAKCYGEHLRKASLFREVNEAFIRQASRRIKHFVILAGDYIVKEGEIDELLYFVHVGVVTFFPEDPFGGQEGDGGRKPEALLKKSSYFGEGHGVYGARRYKYSYIAKTNCDILALSHKDFVELFALFPQYKMRIEARVSRRDKEASKVKEEIDPSLAEYLQIGQQFNKEYNEYPERKTDLEPSESEEFTTRSQFS